MKDSYFKYQLDNGGLKFIETMTKDLVFICTKILLHGQIII
jgi:hypothetical protein